MPKWQKSHFIANLALLPLCIDFFFFSIVKMSFSIFCQKVYGVLGPVQPRPCTYVDTKGPFLNKDDNVKKIFCQKCLHMIPNIEKNGVSILFHFVRVTEVYQPHVTHVQNGFGISLWHQIAKITTVPILIDSKQNFKGFHAL